MKVTCLKVGEMGTNCYLISDEETSEALIIDPGEEADFITTTLLENSLTPKAIILTHGHYDHCLAALELKLNFNIPIYLHPQDIFLYEKAHLSAKRFSAISIPKLPPIDRLIKDRDVISFGNSSLQVVHTPGHTPGSCCFHSQSDIHHPRSDILFTGDTLFSDGVGRTDLSYSSTADLQKSLKKLASLSNSTFIYPGHGEFNIPILVDL